MKIMGAGFVFSFLFSISAFAADSVQSRFSGPVELKVWKHWQASWNVEEIKPERYTFDLFRGHTDAGKPFFRVHFNSLVKVSEARLECEAYVANDMWSMRKEKLQTQSKSLSEAILDTNVFVFEDSNCVDEAQKKIVTKISFQIFNEEGVVVYGYSVKPMYLRGRDQNYWDNEIPSYSAHAGSGTIFVANGIDEKRIDNQRTDTWDGVSVNPTLNFLDRNRMKAGAKIGLHRHEANQELYLIEEGSAWMHMGLAPVVDGSLERVQRKFSLAEGDVQITDQFTAQGGWIESRLMTKGQISVIVPNPSNNNTVYFHGIDAVEDTVFFTMGTKN